MEEANFLGRRQCARWEEGKVTLAPISTTAFLPKKEEGRRCATLLLSGRRLEVGEQSFWSFAEFAKNSEWVQQSLL